MGLRIAYLSTHYPSVSHTFIQGEIVALEAEGVEVVPMALNRPQASDLLTDLDHREAARTFYVKAVAPATIVATVTSAAIRHPVAVTAGALNALRAGGANVGLGVKTLMQFFEAILVWRHCERHGLTAIHAHFGQAPASVASQAAAFGRNVVRRRWTWSATIHGWHEFVTEDTSRLRAKLADADLVVCVSNFTRSQLQRLSPPADWPKLAIVRCGIDFKAFPPRPLASVSAPPMIVIIARLSPEKGHTVLLEAVAQLRRQGFHTTVRVIGIGPFRDDLEKAASRLGIADAIEFTGALPPSEVAAQLRQADVFCLPTFAEGLPVSIMEAMAIGVPVVTTYISGIPELVIDGQTGWVVPAGDPQLLAGAVRDAIVGERRDAIVESARRRTRDRHDRRTNVAQLATLLQDCHDPGGRT